MRGVTRREFLESMCILVASSSIGLADNKGKKIIVLDPGHGMGNRTKDRYDPGAVFGGIYESRIVLDQAGKIGSILTDKGLYVNYTRRDEESNTSLDYRIRFANQLGADIFVSLHCNSFSDESAQGVRVFHYPESLEGKRLGREIHDSLIEKLNKSLNWFRQEYDGLRPESFRVLKDTKMPAVLVESGFLTNERDRRYLTGDQVVVAEGIAEGIVRYLRI